METSVLTSKGQVLIPKRLRKKYGIEAGMKIVFDEAEGGVMIRPVNEEYFKAFRGILTSTGKLKEELKAMKSAEKRLEDRKSNMHKTIKKK